MVPHLRKVLTRLGFVSGRALLRPALGLALLIGLALVPGPSWAFPCVEAYPDVNYGGSPDQFCFIGDLHTNSRFRKNKYSSFKIPPDTFLKVWDKANKTGNSRTYYADVPNVGELINNDIASAYFNYFSSDNFWMVALSDPQITWRHCADDSNSVACANENAFRKLMKWSELRLVRYYNENMRDTLNDFLQIGAPASVFGGVVVNGDLTEFGDKGPDLDIYRKYYERGLNANVYPGLGNHDYQNPVNLCGAGAHAINQDNHCANNMVRYLRDQVETLNPLDFDFSQSSSAGREDYRGSLAYSWEIGDFHFVQLNNYPTYRREWYGYNSKKVKTNYFDIKSAIPWLQVDLADATARGKKIILNFHKWPPTLDNGDSQAELDAFNNEFKTQLLDQFAVSAIFTGHVHGSYGLVEETISKGAAIPVFRSGSVHYGTFLLIHFWNNQLYVFLQKIGDYPQTYTSDLEFTKKFENTQTSGAWQYPLQCGDLPAYQPEGSYRLTCSACRVSKCSLSCLCASIAGPSLFTNLDLNSCAAGFDISNQDGTLACITR